MSSTTPPVVEPTDPPEDTCRSWSALPLTAIFEPRSVAVVGVSRDPTSMSGALLANLVASFSGPIYPVNRHAKRIGLLAVYPTIESIPDVVDLAFIAVPAEHVLGATRECLAKGVRGLVVISAGFSETGMAGRQREAELRHLVRSAGVPLVGPNCMGVLNNSPGATMNGTFSLPQPPSGNVAICTQSGALGFVFPDYIARWDIGISKLVSIGNKTDVGENDVLAYYGQDPTTRVIQLYLESLQDPQHFLSIVRPITRLKPIVTLKAGATEAGRRAAGSHTAALASPSRAVEALLAQSGVVRVHSLKQLFQTTALLATQPLPRGRRVAVVTNAGGPAVLCADALEARGLELPELSTELQAQLRSRLPAEAAVRNPIDLIGTVDPDEFSGCVRSLLDSAEVDTIMVVYVPRLAGTSPVVAHAVATTAAQSRHDKTLLGIFMDTSTPPDLLRTETMRMPAFRFPEEAADALAGAVEYAERRTRRTATIPFPEEMDPAVLRAQVQSQLAHLPSEGGWLSPAATNELLAGCGLALPAWSVARSRPEALEAGQQIGYPLVVKALSPTLVHKTEHGAVLLDIRTPAELSAAWERAHAAAADVQGVLLQQFVRGGREVLLGIARDPAFGTLIGVGLGGVRVEAEGRVAFRLLPLLEGDLDELLAAPHLRSHLAAYRGAPAADVEALRAAVVRIAALARAVPEIREADLNPITVLPAGQGLRVLDGRLFAAPSAQSR